MTLWSIVQDSVNWIMSRFWDFQNSESWPRARSFFRRDRPLLRGTLRTKPRVRKMHSCLSQEGVCKGVCQDLARIRSPLPQPSQPPVDPQTLSLEMALPPRDRLLEVRGEGAVGWSARLHEHHEGLTQRDRKTLGAVVSPLGKCSGPQSCTVLLFPT